MARVQISKKVYNKKYIPYLDACQRVQIFFGGSSSGKSKFIAQRTVRDLLKGGRNFLCTRNVSRTLKTSIFNELKKVINEWGVDSLFSINKTDLTITCKNGYQALFRGLDDIEKVKSITPEKGTLTDVIVEEATECEETAIKQLGKRLRGVASKVGGKRITLLFNPILQSHWIFRRYFASRWIDGLDLYKDDRYLIVKSTYKDNRFLAPDDIAELEDEKDEYFYQVYTLGNWGSLGGLIFTRYETRDLLNDPIFKTFDQFDNGLDFGFTSAPTALVRSYYHRASETLYITHTWGEKRQTNKMIAEAIKPIIGDEPVECDSAEPKSINELQGLGIAANEAKKGPGSIMSGVKWLKQQNIVVDIRCQGILNNMQQYCWATDKHGNQTGLPVDRANDYIDALRYGNEKHMEGVDRWDEDYNGVSPIAAAAGYQMGDENELDEFY